METVSSDSSRAILIFSKSAEYGNVKTRLRTVLNDDACLGLHLAMLRDTVHCCLSIGADVLLYLAGKSGLPFDAAVPVRSQIDGDLGSRMKQAFAETLNATSPVVIVGTDAPGLTAEILESAFASLKRHDVVLGPSDDGGYYLIGLRKMIPKLFDGIPWSTPDVLRLTLNKLPAGATHLLPRLFDIDQPDDLLRLEREIHSGSFPHASHTRNWLKSKI